MAEKEKPEEEEKPELIPLEGVVFDVGKLTVQEWFEHLDNVAGRLAGWQIKEHWVGIFTKTVIRCPAEWGDPSMPETYDNLLLFSEWETLQAMFWKAVDDERKNRRRPSVTA
jgi:hypothetical protein